MSLAPQASWPARLTPIAAYALAALVAAQPDAVLSPPDRSGWLSLSLGIAAAVGAMSWSLRERQAGNPAPAIIAFTRGIALPVTVGLLACALIGWRSTCDGRASALNAATAVIPSILVWGAAAAFAIQRARRLVPAAVLLGAMVIASLVWASVRVVTHPQFFAEDPFGLSSVEERAGLRHLYVPSEGVAAQLVSLAFAGLLLLLAVPLRTYATPRGLGAAVLSIVALFAVVTGAALRPHAFGVGATIEEVEAALSSRATSEHFELHYAPDLSEAEARAILDELEFSLERLAPIFQPPAGPRIQAYLYGSEKLKRELVFAEWVDFTEMAPRRLHLTSSMLPHATLRHELVHLLSAEWGRWPFAQSWRGAFEVNAGLMEGLAEALHEPNAEHTLHERAHALRKGGLAPDLRELMEGEAFDDHPALIAYTLSGSFVRYLLDTRGPEAVRRTFPDGDWHKGFDAGLEQLAAEWERHVDGLTLSSDRVAAVIAELAPRVPPSHACFREATAILNRASYLEEPPDVRELQRCVALAPSLVPCRAQLSAALDYELRGIESTEHLAVANKLVQRRSGESVDLAFTTLWRYLYRDGLYAEAEAERAISEVLITPSPAVDQLTAWSYEALYEPSYADLREDLRSGSRGGVYERYLQGLAARLSPPADPRVVFLLQSVDPRHPRTREAERLEVSYDRVPPSARGGFIAWDLGNAWRSSDCDRVRRIADAEGDLSTAVRQVADEYLARCAWAERTGRLPPPATAGDLP